MDLTIIDRALGSNIPYITYAVPVFFLLIGVELVMAMSERKNYYRLHDSINDLSCGSTEQIIGLFLKGLLFLGYQGTYGYATRTGINLIDVHSYSPGGKWLAAIVLFLGVDCAYYWFTASLMSTTGLGPGTWCTTRARITTSPWRCGRGRSRASSPGSSTCRWRCWAFHHPGSPRS